MVRTQTEVKGVLPLASGFRLTARADRIDVAEDGSVVIYDYKTGTLPLATHVTNLYAPQLPLEAAIAEAGGFAELGARPVRDLVYIQASGRQEGGEERQASTAGVEALSVKAREDLERLVAYFEDPDTPYEVKRRLGAGFTGVYRHDDYEHLARVKEWLTQEAEEEWR